MERQWTWDDLYMLREAGRQRREATVALQRVKLSKHDEQEKRRAMLRALAVLVEQCPLMWGE